MGQSGGELETPPPPSPRTSALAFLYQRAADLADAGDEAGVAALHASITVLLRPAMPGDDAGVISLAVERARRGGS